MRGTVKYPHVNDRSPLQSEAENGATMDINNICWRGSRVDMIREEVDSKGDSDKGGSQCKN